MRRSLMAIVLTSLLGIAQQAPAFPGQTAEELIRVLGPPANGHPAPPVPAVEAVLSGRAQLSSVYWPQATYHPLQSGPDLKGILVTTFDYRAAGLAERVVKDPSDIGWEDLVSRSEVFLSFVSPQAFQQLLGEIAADWTVTSKTHHGAGVGYDLYSVISKDGRFQGEISYSPKGHMPPLPQSGQPPVLNFWTRISAVR